MLFGCGRLGGMPQAQVARKYREARGEQSEGVLVLDSAEESRIASCGAYLGSTQGEKHGELSLGGPASEGAVQEHATTIKQGRKLNDRD